MSPKQATLEMDELPQTGASTAMAPRSEPREVSAALPPATSVIELIDRALQAGVPVEHLERLQLMLEREQDRAAAREFHAALAAFQAECPPIARRTKKRITTKQGIGYPIQYAELDEIARTVGPHLHRHGLSYTWDTVTEGTMLHVTCIVRHTNGHKESARFSCKIESPNANASDHHKAGGTMTFARRYSLTAALGVTTADPDTNGADPTPITAEQADDLQALIEECGVNVARFLKWAGVKKLAELPASEYESAVNVIRSTSQQRAARKGGGAS